MSRSSERRLEGWWCQGQTDLLDLVDTEHIDGSMPASDEATEDARREFYRTFTDRKRDEDA